MGTKVKIDKAIIGAIRRAINDAGSQTAFAERAGINQPTVNMIVNGNTKSITRPNWIKLHPLIKQYLPTDSDLPAPRKHAEAGGKDAPQTARQEAKPAESSAMLKVPVIGFAAAATANPALMPIAEFASEYADDYQAFPLAQPGDFCLVVSGDSMLPWYPEGTRLLCRPCRPGRGQRVVAVLGSGEVVFKVFVEKDDKFCLFSINEDGQDYVFSKTDYTAVRAIYPIIESIRDEQAIDKAMRSSGIRHRWEDKLKEL